MYKKRNYKRQVSPRIGELKLIFELYDACPICGDEVLVDTKECINGCNTEEIDSFEFRRRHGIDGENDWTRDDDYEDIVEHRKSTRVISKPLRAAMNSRINWAEIDIEDLCEEHKTFAAVSSELGVSPQAVSRRYKYVTEIEAINRFE